MVNVATFGNARVAKKNYFSEAHQVCLQGLCSLSWYFLSKEQNVFGLSALMLQQDQACSF